MLEWASRYIRLGWPVLPLNGKVPMTEHGSKDATLDLDQARTWWAKWPDANIGLATGLRFFVVDVDVRKGGEESWDALRLKHAGGVPATIEQLTGTGGKHILYSLPDFSVKNSEGKIGPGIDVRGSGGYIVACPSVHPETKRRYAWDGLTEIEQQKIAPAPSWLLAALHSESIRKHSAPTPRKIAKGQRNDVLFRAGARLRRFGFSAEEIFASLKAINAARCHPPLDSAELRTIADSASRYTPAADLSSVPKLEDAARDWTELLIKGKHGKRAPVVGNALIALRGCPAWHGVLGFDQSALKVMVRKTPPWKPESRSAPFAWTDEDDTRTAAWLQGHGILASPITAAQAVRTVASEFAYHPIRDYLDGLVWDGDGRLDIWLSDYLGVQPSEYVAAVGARWLIGAVARIYEPGCKNDVVLILEGEQGTLKSSSLRVLAQPWFSDDMPEVGTKDSAVQLRGLWIIELSELDAMTRGEVGRIKAFASRSVDRFRPPYGRLALDVPRECVFSGSCNVFTYLRDETGGRRFWPVRCGAIDLEQLALNRDQLWSEAVARYRGGARWWLDRKELVEAAREEQEDRYDCDSWDELIKPWIAGRKSVSIGEILSECLGKVAALWTQPDKNRVARSLRAAKWERFNAGPRGAREWRYRPLEQEHGGNWNTDRNTGNQVKQ